MTLPGDSREAAPLRPSSLAPNEVFKLLPRRRPCLFIDEILELDAEHAATKYAWRDEDCAGHFPGNPIVPGVKMLEMAAQTAAAWGIYLKGGRGEAEEPVLAGIDRALFKMSVRPGETVTCRASFGKDGAFENGRMLAEVELRFLGGPKDGEPVFAGKIAGVWRPLNAEVRE